MDRGWATHRFQYVSWCRPPIMHVCTGHRDCASFNDQGCSAGLIWAFLIRSRLVDGLGGVLEIQAKPSEILRNRLRLDPNS
jgi:hypothetical protein